MEFKAESVYKAPHAPKEKERDVQGRMILAVKTHLLKQLKDPLPTHMTVLWDHKHDPDQNAEEPALYAGEKLRGSGRRCRNGAVDVMVRDEEARTVELLVEVEPNLEPKKFWGDVGAAMDSDRHVPSRRYCDDWHADEHKNSYFLSGTLLVLVTVCGTEKEDQLKEIAVRIRERFGIPNARVQELILCAGRNEEQALDSFTQLAERIVFDRS